MSQPPSSLELCIICYRPCQWHTLADNRACHARWLADMIEKDAHCPDCQLAAEIKHTARIRESRLKLEAAMHEEER